MSGYAESSLSHLGEGRQFAHHIRQPAPLHFGPSASR